MPRSHWVFLARILHVGTFAHHPPRFLPVSFGERGPSGSDLDLNIRLLRPVGNLRLDHILAQGLQLVDRPANGRGVPAACRAKCACVNHHGGGLRKLLPLKVPFAGLRRNLGRIHPAPTLQCVTRRNRRQRIGSDEMLRAYCLEGVDFVPHAFGVAVTPWTIWRTRTCSKAGTSTPNACGTKSTPSRQ